MRILVISNTLTWRKNHFTQMCRGLSLNGHEVELLNYKIMNRLGSILKIPFWGYELTQRSLERNVRAFQPDLILFILARERFDLKRLRSYYSGLITLWDYDGPNLKLYRNPEYLKDFDRIVSVSRSTAEHLKRQGFQAEYLPHGVCCDYYRPSSEFSRDRSYQSPVSYIGVPTPRRIELCQSLAPYGLALYGRRWHKLPECQKGQILNACVRGTQDVFNEEVLKIYQSSSCVLNTLQENLAANHTIMSLQVFAVPACESCLITEYVDELPDAFENGKELLWYRNLEELEELVKKYTTDKAAARAIGINGRKRCLADHTQQIRMKQLLKLFE